MATQSSPLHILFFPFLAHGHMLPMADTARLFASRGFKCTFITTPANIIYIGSIIDRTNKFLEGKNDPDLVPISISLIPFPSSEVGLPDGVENVSVPNFVEVRAKFFHAVKLLEDRFERKLKEVSPDAFVSDTFFTWSIDVSARTGIPRLVFSGMGLLAHSAQEKLFPIGESIPADNDTFVIPGLPHRLEMHRTQLKFSLNNKEVIALFKRSMEMDSRSYGEIVNSFLELEADYAVHWREVVGRKIWLIGPVALCNEDFNEKFSGRGGNSPIGNEELLNWLDGKRPGSVLYICFGSIGSSNISLEQIKKIGIALEDSNRNFIWVVKSLNKEGFDDWLEGFEQRIGKQNKGFVIKGWAPQLLLLNHPAVGGFLTHYGWNSTLEAICAGVPMITWPMIGDQFFNEKLIVEILGVGAAIGVKEGDSDQENRQLIEPETIRSVIETVMGEGVEGAAIRKRTKELKEKAKAAVEEGGSSYVELGNLIEELLARRNTVSSV